MNTQENEINGLLDDELDAVAGGIRNDPLTTAMRIAELAPSIAASKALGDAPGGVYVGNTATTAGGSALA